MGRTATASKRLWRRWRTRTRSTGDTTRWARKRVEMINDDDDGRGSRLLAGVEGAGAQLFVCCCAPGCSLLDLVPGSPLWRGSGANAGLRRRNAGAARQVHYGVPEGSYSTEPDGPLRVLEYREMVQVGAWCRRGAGAGEEMVPAGGLCRRGNGAGGGMVQVGRWCRQGPASRPSFGPGALQAAAARPWRREGIAVAWTPSRGERASAADPCRSLRAARRDCTAAPLSPAVSARYGFQGGSGRGLQPHLCQRPPQPLQRARQGRAGVLPQVRAAQIARRVI